MNQKSKSTDIVKLEEVAKVLEKNNFTTHMAKDKKEAKDIIRSLLKKGDVISSGGSVTLEQIGIKELLASGEYEWLDKENKKSERVAFYQKAQNCDMYLTSSNAITESGELYNVDGFGNRVAVFSFGPKKVIVVAGINKIVKNIEEAVRRVKTIAAPYNCMRLKKNTPCAQKGQCIAVNGNMTEGCQSPDRICRHYVITSNQRNDLKRIEIILVGEELGY
ncbi:lactate utilization protein [Scatolibacter rhodanostii]|uniref:lactate utilization protein n=1 Tax=Scatolibacter rhodanostii TaxID=2014781 RepID=UPI000C089A8B|nr:lactate utilization protein [Scatolibacter rhodanostii]